ncbi:hypothetical protein [Roseisolibacter sp. H3M3-2]|uniref:hypothetical protein n=1 Tax=Roseisolibacter sp. H3M3-2 TaxID=3031323 RepID=UPI0023DCEA93|nr:hypothetical protein [Roseisolibacter sp. H3M3-2]MDF1504643.1 hypothetical protein [Roseisolibacter sp. H3M3-2]
MRIRPLLLASVVVASVLAACSGGGALGDVNVDMSGDSAARAFTLAEGDVAITSTEGVAVLALVGDTVRLQLSDSLRAHVRAEVDSQAGEAGAIGGMIAGAVGRVVGGAMGFVVRLPVEDVENVRYEDGHVRFESRRNAKFSFGTDGDGGDGKGMRFSEADGQRFVEAVKQRQRELGVQE